MIEAAKFLHFSFYLPFDNYLINNLLFIYSRNEWKNNSLNELLWISRRSYRTHNFFFHKKKSTRRRRWLRLWLWIPELIHFDKQNDFSRFLKLNIIIKILSMENAIWQNVKIPSNRRKKCASVHFSQMGSSTSLGIISIEKWIREDLVQVVDGLEK